MQKVRKAIIPAAGLGTRFLPATKALAKEMLPIVDKPTIQFIVEEAKASGIEDILIIEGKSSGGNSTTWLHINFEWLLRFGWRWRDNVYSWHFADWIVRIVGDQHAFQPVFGRP